VIGKERREIYMEERSREPQMGLTFEKVWAALMESREKFEREMKESREKVEREMEKSRENVEREMKESREKAERDMEKLRKTQEETARIVGSLGNRFGELAEHLILPNIAEKFNTLNYNFTRTSANTRFKDKDGQVLAEIDALLENGDFVMIVEVKAQPTDEHVREHEERMEVLRRYADEHGDGRKYIGAIAGAIMHDQVKHYALKHGFYVIEQSGDTVKIDVPQNFKPKEW
jgi:hypothetical protein